MTVAIAAPMTLSSGNGPIPKIKRGSRMILMISPTVVAENAARLFPIAVKIPVNV